MEGGIYFAAQSKDTVYDITCIHVHLELLFEDQMFPPPFFCILNINRDHILCIVITKTHSSKISVRERQTDRDRHIEREKEREAGKTYFELHNYV